MANGRKIWTEEDVKKLKLYANRKTSQELADMFGVSIKAVRSKLGKLGYNKHTDFISIKMVSKCFNCDYKTVDRWIKKYDMPYKENVYCRYIEPEDFWYWCAYKKDLLPFHKYNVGSIAPEPKWVKPYVVKRKHNESNIRSGKKITDEEVAIIKQMINMGKTYEEISERTGRSVQSVRHIFSDRIRPYMNCPKMKLERITDEEREQALILRAHGYSRKEVADQIGRSVYSVAHIYRKDRERKEKEQKKNE